MKEIGEQCGGWIEMEEETQIRNDLRWARLRVKGALKDIPTYVEASDGEYIFSLPVWCEAPARYRRKFGDKHFEKFSKPFVENLFTSKPPIKLRIVLSEEEMGDAAIPSKLIAGEPVISETMGDLENEANSMHMIIGYRR
ncbi:hypothetical protein FXO37_15519 [Capsicum annuum]|nr:hypothetical protein FXO37_15519 [Capsicum annuum]